MYHLTCSQSTVQHHKQHFFRPIASNDKIDIEFLKNLLLRDYEAPEQECGIIEPLSTRRKFCGMY